MSVMSSPFIVPVAGCVVGVFAILAGTWSDVQQRAMRSRERLAMLEQDIPLEEIEKVLSRGEDSNRAKDPLRSLANARRAGVVLVSSGLGLSLFFVVLAAVLRERNVLTGAAIGVIPLAIGIGFFVDYYLQRRELSRFGLEVGAESSGVRLDG